MPIVKKELINKIINNELWISDIFVKNLKINKNRYSKIHIVMHDEYNCLDVILLKIISNTKTNTPITIKVNEKRLLNSEILLSNDWYTYNFIDLNIYGMMRNIEIYPINFIDTIYLESIPRNDNIFNFNNMNIDSNNITYKKNSKYKIAIISNEFTFNNFDLEFDCDYITNNFDIINNLNIDNYDFLVCESTFRGLDGSWANHFTKYDNNIYGKNLLLLVDKFKSKSKKTIFYNKEDPIFFDIFYNVSTIFDIVITTNKESVPKYNNSKVLSFPFIINPIIHNPLNKTCDKFAAYPGTFYNFFENRKSSMELNLEKLININNIDIYDRYYIKNKFIDQTNQLKKPNIEYKFPSSFNKFIKPNLNHIQVTDNVYKKYKFIINFNTVQDSTTMCSRRAIECAGCGTNVISDNNNALIKIYKDKIIYFDNIKSIDDLNIIEDINLYLYYKTHLNLTIHHLLNLIFDKSQSKNDIIIIKNNKTKISSNILNKITFINYDKYLIEDKDKFDDFHKLFILDEEHFYDEKYIEKLCLPLNYTNNNIFITNNKNDYFKETSKDYIKNIYLENKYTTNNKIFINNNLKDFYKNPFDIEKYENTDIKIFENELYIFAIYNENIFDIINELNKVEEYKINLYIWSKISINLDNVNFNIEYIVDDTINEKFGLFILIKNIIKKININKVIIINKSTDFNKIINQLSEQYDFYGMYYNDNFDIITDTFYIINSKILIDNNEIYYLNKMYIDYFYEWFLFIVNEKYNISKNITNNVIRENPSFIKDELLYNEFSLY